MPPRLSTFRSVAGLAVTTVLLTACAAAPSTSPASTEPSTESVSPSAPASPSMTASPASPQPTATPAASAGAVVVTIRVAGAEEYRVELTDPADIELARQLLAGDEVLATIPNGEIVRGDPGVNSGYSWHIDPNTFEWAEVTTEVCDGLPSYVEAGTLSGPRFCPWQAEVVDIKPAP